MAMLLHRRLQDSLWATEQSPWLLRCLWQQLPGPAMPLHQVPVRPAPHQAYPLLFTAVARLAPPLLLTAGNRLDPPQEFTAVARLAPPLLVATGSRLDPPLLLAAGSRLDPPQQLTVMARFSTLLAAASRVNPLNRWAFRCCPSLQLQR